MNNITLDTETFSSVDIGKSGVYRYAESPDFEILLFACSVDGQPVQVYDLACGEKVPDEILKALTDEKVIKHSYNASMCKWRWGQVVSSAFFDSTAKAKILLTIPMC